MPNLVHIPRQTIRALLHQQYHFCCWLPSLMPHHTNIEVVRFHHHPNRRNQHNHRLLLHIPPPHPSTFTSPPPHYCFSPSPTTTFFKNRSYDFISEITNETKIGFLISMMNLSGYVHIFILKFDFFELFYICWMVLVIFLVYELIKYWCLCCCCWYRYRYRYVWMVVVFVICCL